MTHRPTIAPAVLAAIISAAPERLQKRLDREPRAADAWEWSETNGQWTVHAGEESVRIPAGVIRDVAQVQCSCLLSPRCFHVLAVLNVAEIAGVDEVSSGAVVPEYEVGSETPSEPISPQETRDSEGHSAGELPSLTEAQHRSAKLMFEACAGILATGLRAAGALLQSRLLRAIHECRSEGLHRIAAGGLRLMNNLRQLRDGDDQFRSAAAEADFREVLEACVRLKCLHVAFPESRAAGSDNAAGMDALSVGTGGGSGTHALPGSFPVSVEWIGIARRSFQPINSLKLHALFCEPILTRSGYSGVVTWLISDDGWIGTVSDVQPGDAKRIPQAWRSGVSLAGLSLSHRDLSQKCLLISKATRSIDGRLGGGESARAVAIDGRGWNAPPIESRFRTPLPDQIRTAFAQPTGVDFLQPAGTDLAFFTAVVAGYSGQELVVREVNSEILLRLAIAVDDDGVAFRSSLQTLSRAPRLALRCIGRVDFSAAGRIQLLAVAPAGSDAAEVAGSPTFDRPVLVLPTSVPVASIGLEEITRSHLSRAEAQPVNVLIGGGEGTSSPGIHYDDALERWLRAIIVGGRHAIPQGLVTSAVRDAARLKAGLRPAAASMLHALTQSTIATKTELTGIRFSESPDVLATKWLAAAIGSRAATTSLQLKEWMLQLESSGSRSG